MLQAIKLIATHIIVDHAALLHGKSCPSLAVCINWHRFTPHQSSSGTYKQTIHPSPAKHACRMGRPAQLGGLHESSPKCALLSCISTLLYYTLSCALSSPTRAVQYESPHKL